MRIHGGTVSALVLLTLALPTGCERAPEGWTPVMEETSTAFLEAETQRALDHVQQALDHLEGTENPAQMENDLREAESTLTHLLDYYLPLVQARERAYNAYRLHFLEDEAAVDRELARIEDILTSMAAKAEGQRLLEIEALAETLGDARMAAAANSGQEEETLETLARNLNQAAIKGDLVLKR